MSTAVPVQKLHRETSDVENILDQIGHGFAADEASNRQKLEIARQYGPLLLQLKEMVPHGQFKQTLRHRFPSVSYSKCHRWMALARRESEVAAALAQFPEVAWGPKKMLDYLQGEWSPDSPQADEDDFWGLAAEDDTGQLDDLPDICPQPQETEDALAPLWEEFVQAAESDAEQIGTVQILQAGACVVVTLVEPDQIEAALAQWSPRRVPILNRKAINLNLAVEPGQIPSVLVALGKALAKSLPSELKVSVEI